MNETVVNGRTFKLRQCEITRFEDEFGHSYEINGEPIASVTTLLSMGTPVEQGLLEYFKRTDKDTQEDILTDAQQRGSNVHQAIEQLLLGEAVVSEGFVREREKASIAAFVEFFETIKPTEVLSEQIVAYLRGDIKFAGTLDFIATVNSKRLLIDFKTSKSPSIKHSLQAEAYKAAIEQSTDEKIDDCYVLYLGTSHKGTRSVKDSNGLPNTGSGWSLVKSKANFKDFGLAYRMALFMNGGEYPKPSKVIVYPERWKILG